MIFKCFSIRSPVTVRKAPSRHSSTSPEKSPAKKLPPRNPRSLFRRSTSGLEKKSSSSRPSSSSPEKALIQGQSGEEILERVKSSSPSPVRTIAPKPTSPSPVCSIAPKHTSQSPVRSLAPKPSCVTQSVEYSSSFASSSSVSSSPSNSPCKPVTSHESQIHTDISGSPPGLLLHEYKTFHDLEIEK